MNTATFQSNRFQRLRWKLTLNYMAVTVGAIITVEILLLAVLAIFFSIILNSGQLQEEIIKIGQDSYASTLRYFLGQTPPDQEGIAIWLESISLTTANTLPLSFEPSDEMLVIGRDSTLLGTIPPNLLGNEAIGRIIDTQSIPGLSGPLQSAMAGTDDPEQLYTRPGSAEKLVMAIPIWDENEEQVLGVLVGIEDSPTFLSLISDALPILIGSLLFFSIISGLIGTVYGYFAAREPVHQLERLSKATIAWSQGDFSARVQEPTADEFGLLAGRLNDMAQQLAQLMETRRELAIIDERGRLARELHDSAKQLAFAAAAQIGGVRTLIQRDPAAAEAHLVESERLLDDLRQELTGMILELRPPALVGEGLDTAVRSYLNEWARQNDIQPKLQIENTRPLPPEIEQPLFRILQEALANVARHSGADNVTVSLVYTAENVTLTISDNGSGFDTDSTPGGFGLASMRQRTEALGGQLTVQSNAGSGTTITCTIPTRIRAANEKAAAYE